MPTPLPISGQNWLITPVAAAFGEQAPTNISEQKWLLILSGVAVANFQGNSTALWNEETITILPDMGPPSGAGPLNWAINRYSIPVPPPGTYTVDFALDDSSWVPFAALSRVIDQNQSINAGYAVDLWRPTPFVTGTDAFSGAPVGNVFAGIDVDLSVRDTDAYIQKVSYNISLIGKIVFLQEEIIQVAMVKVPDVMNLPASYHVSSGLQAAHLKLESVGLGFTTTPVAKIGPQQEQYYNVTAQNPRPGAMVAKNSSVELTVELKGQ